MRVDLMHLLPRFAFIVVGSLAFTGVRAQELLPPETEVASAVDHYITDKLQSRSIEPRPVADDATVLRRTMLDLAGRVPTAREHQWFFDQPETVRRDVLVDRLMQSSDYGCAQAMLNSAQSATGVGAAQYRRGYLQCASQSVRQVLLQCGRQA